MTHLLCKSIFTRDALQRADDHIQKSTRGSRTEKDLKIAAFSATPPEGEASRDCFVFLFKQKRKKKPHTKKRKKPDYIFLMLVTPKKNSHESVNAKKKKAVGETSRAASAEKSFQRAIRFPGWLCLAWLVLLPTGEQEEMEYQKMRF